MTFLWSYLFCIPAPANPLAPSLSMGFKALSALAHYSLFTGILLEALFMGTSYFCLISYFKNITYTVFRHHDMLRLQVNDEDTGWALRQSN